MENGEEAAQKEYELVAKEVPESIEIIANMFVLYFSYSTSVLLCAINKHLI